MNCERIQPLIEPFFDGELGEAESRLVEAHVAACQTCSDELELMMAEQELFDRYDRGFEPSPDMWQGVLERIAPEPSPARPGFFERLTAAVGGLFVTQRLVPFAAGAFVLVLVGSVALTALHGDLSQGAGTVHDAGEGIGPQVPPEVPKVDNGRRSVGPPIVPPIVPVADNRKAHNRGSSRGELATNRTKPPVDPVAKVEKSYIAAIDKLQQDVKRNEHLLQPEVRESIQKPLKDIDANIVLAKQAVDRNPNDPLAVASMMAAYDEKMDVLQRLARYQVARDDR